MTDKQVARIEGQLKIWHQLQREREKLDHACGLAPNDMTEQEANAIKERIAARIEEQQMTQQIAQASADADLELLAKRCIELESMLKGCVEAMEYVVNHEHDAYIHEDKVRCHFCERINSTIHKAKEMVR